MPPIEPWSKRLTQLNDTLGELVPVNEKIPKYIRNADLKVQNISFAGGAIDTWGEVIDEARKRDKIDSLVGAVLEDYPEDPFLKSALKVEEINYSLSPDIDEVSGWKGLEETTLEKLTMNPLGSILPINFLERGIMKSRSVAKLAIERGGVIDVGTGFLFKLNEAGPLFFLTNFHVINDKSDIQNTKIIFNFELDVDGNSKASISLNIDPDFEFISSPVKELDFTCLKIADPDNKLGPFSFLKLKKVKANQDDFVNIIQHPAGEMKQIALYHNIVTHTTENVIQYLTDTMKGSSGAPVFNSNWDVVALHHSGGKPKDNEPKLKEAKYRNEGIQISKIIDFIEAKLKGQ